jgi:AcrR family transcriptional regulator
MRETKASDERRQEFMDAAEKLFKKNGIVDTTVNNIVKEVDVAKGLFYYYFKSKDDVIDAISARYNEAFRQTMDEEKKETAMDWDEKMKNFSESCIHSFEQMKENLQGDTDDVDLSELAFKSLKQAREAASKTLNELLEEGKKAGKVHVEHLDYYADLITGGIAYLVARGRTDAEVITKMIRDLLERSGKEDEK